MQVDFNTQTSNSFGMALHMNERRIQHQIGRAMSDAARKAIPELEELAKDCKISVKPYVSELYGSKADAFEVRVRRGLFRIVKGITSDRSTLHTLNRPFEDDLIKTAKVLKDSL